MTPTNANTHSALTAILRDIGLFSAHVIRTPLRPYQLEPARAIADSVLHGRGLAFTLMFSRQAGKNEVSGQLEAYLLTIHQRVGGTIVKAAPTFRPQLVNSMMRLHRCLNNPWTKGLTRQELHYIIKCDNARCLFLSASADANVVGATASIAMEFDEAQDILIDKHDKDFMPMGATRNATRVYYGTAWTEDTLLYRQVEAAKEAHARDGIRRHFEVPWGVVAEQNPAYGRYVEAEKARLGETHPLFRTQYLLQTIAGGGRFLSDQQLAQAQGEHQREHRRSDDATYVAGIDVAGEDEEAADAALRSLKPRRDSTVVTIAELDLSTISDLVTEPRLLVRDFYWWTGRGHREQFEQLLDLLANVWGVSRVCVDATGVGAGVASFLLSALGESTCEPVTFSSTVKSSLGFDLLAAVNGGRLKLYHEDPAGPELTEFRAEAEAARYDVRGNQLLQWYVPADRGHDDFLTSAALAVRAAAGYGVAPAAGQVRADVYQEGQRW